MMKNTLGHHSVITFVWLLTICFVLLSGCETVEAPSLPVVGLTSVSAVTESTIDCVGSVTTDGGSPITMRGFCWSTKTSPTLDDDMLADSSGLGIFQEVIAELESGTTYYVRAFATNLAGTSYGEQVTIKTKICSLTTTSPYFILATTAYSGGFLTTDFDSTSVLARGVCWNTFPNPTLSDSLTIDKLGKGGYTSSMLNLKPLTTYYVRSYVTTSTGVTYGNEVNFTTQSGVIGLVTEPIKNITAVSATFSGQLSGDGGAVVTECGFVWGTAAQPTTSDHIMRSETISEKFSCNVTDLTPNYTYYLRAYAINAAGISYGNERTFITRSGAISLTTNEVSEITTSSALSGGNCSSDGGSNVVSRGVCWGEEHSPTVSLATKTENGYGLGSYSSTMTGLSPGKIYYVRAYATNVAGTSYGSEQSFVTLATLPYVTTTAATEITSSSATTGGLVTTDGSALITARGICWSIYGDPQNYPFTQTLDGTGPGSFISSLTNLNFGTNYWVRAYATNSAGTAYGNLISFITEPILATVTTNEATNLTAFSASISGKVNNEGGSSVITRGICWSVSPNPTINDSKIENGNGMGTFPISLTGLIQGTTYHARAFATNAVGVAYGNDFIFKTLDAVINLTTSAASTISTTSVILGGNINGVGGSTVTSRGVCWSINPNPSLTDGQLAIASTSDLFSGKVTGLTANAKYYVRAYATNAVGTYYGNEITFNTLPLSGTVSDIDGNVYNYITIGSQTWMVENLKTTKYRNGESIGTTTPANKDISNESTPKYQWAFNGDEGNVSKYGRLYTWYTLSDSRNIAPTGWHVATDAEWFSLENYLIANGYNYDGTTTGNKISKSLAAKTDWSSATNPGAVGNDLSKNNASGFTGLPGGYRFSDGTFNYKGEIGFWWSPGVATVNNDWQRNLEWAGNTLVKFSALKKCGNSVRCVRD